MPAKSCTKAAQDLKKKSHAEKAAGEFIEALKSRSAAIAPARLKTLGE